MGTPLHLTLHTRLLFQCVWMSSSMLCVRPSRPRFTCLLPLSQSCTISSTSSALSGSPSISSLLRVYFGACPAGNGPGACTPFAPFFRAGGTKESNAGRSVWGPNGENSDPGRNPMGATLGVSV